MRWSKLALTYLALGAIAVAFAACGGDGDAGTDSEGSTILTYTSFGGAFQEAETAAWLEPYQAENPGVTIQQDQPIDLAKLKAMQESGNVTWDVISTGDSDPYNNEETLEPIDCEIVDCDAFIESGHFDGFRAPYYTWATVLAYNTEKTGGEPPSGWADFFDTEKFPGKRALWSYVTADTLEPALVADGVPSDQLYPLDVDRALAKLREIKDNIIWYETGAECQELVSSGEAVMGNCWNGRIYEAQQQGEPVDIQWNECFLLIGSLGVPKGSKNVEEAMKLVAYITSEKSVELSKHIAYGPTNKHVLDEVEDELKPFLPTSHSDRCIQVDRRWMIDNAPAVQEALQKFQAE